MANGEIFNFKFYEGSTGTIYDLHEQIEFVSDMTEGNGMAPVPLHWNSVSTVNMITLDDISYIGVFAILYTTRSVRY